MCEALVLFNLSDSLLFFEAVFKVVKRFIRKANKIGCDCQGELTEADFAIWMVAKTSQDSIYVFLQNFSLEFEKKAL